VEKIDPSQCSDDLEKILAHLYNCKATNAGWANAVEISHSLGNEHGIYLHWRTIDTVLQKQKDLVSRRKRNNRWHYSILANGECLLKPNSAITLVDPSKAVQAVLKLHEFLSKLYGDIRICDPYIDDKTIEHLDSCPQSSTILLLSQTIRDSGKLRRLLSAFRASGKNLTIRQTAGSKLHDRYIIDSKAMMILGTSLNGLGKKQCFIIQAGSDFRKIILKEFENIWKNAQTWPS
jgi:hypothetical protein